MHDNTVVTACNSKYFWGAFLLGLSIRRAGGTMPLHVLHEDLSPEQIGLLEQLGDVHGFQTSTAYAMLQKPEALLTAETTWATWMDCDIIWESDLTSKIGGARPGIQIRVRGPIENAMQFPRETSASNDKSGAVPDAILSRWCEDVGERATPRLTCMAVSNALALHQDFRWLAARWRELMLQVSKNPSMLVDRSNPAYRITDEAALTALLAYTETEVPVLPYVLDEEPPHRVIHFEGRPKPWQGWQQRYFKHFDAVAETIVWGKEQGYTMPDVPAPMLATNRRLYQWQARIDAIRKGARRQLVNGARRVLR